MKHLRNVMGGFLGLLVVGGVTLVVVWAWGSGRSSLQPAFDIYQSPIGTVTPHGSTATPLRPQLPTATPLVYTPAHTGTPLTSTPRPGETAIPDSSTPTLTFTPMPITDLAEGVPDEEKRVFIIRRADGKYEQYIIPTSRWEDRRQLVNLGPQDEIVAAYPFKPVQSTPWIPSPTPALPTSTVFISPLPSPTSTAQP